MNRYAGTFARRGVVAGTEKMAEGVVAPAADVIQETGDIFIKGVTDGCKDCGTEIKDLGLKGTCAGFKYAFGFGLICVVGDFAAEKFTDRLSEKLGWTGW